MQNQKDKMRAHNQIAWPIGNAIIRFGILKEKSVNDDQSFGAHMFAPFEGCCQLCCHRQNCLALKAMQIDHELGQKLRQHLPLGHLNPLAATIMSKIFGSRALNPMQQHGLFWEVEIISRCSSLSKVRALIAKIDGLAGAENTTLPDSFSTDVGVVAVIELFSAVVGEGSCSKEGFVDFGWYLGLSEAATKDIIEIAGITLISRLWSEMNESPINFDQCFAEMSHTIRLFD